MSPESVKGLPPDLSSGFTLTEWECEQRVKAVRADYEAAVDSLTVLVEQSDYEAGTVAAAVVEEARGVLDRLREKVPA